MFSFIFSYLLVFFYKFSPQISSINKGAKRSGAATGVGLGESALTEPLRKIAPHLLPIWGWVLKKTLQSHPTQSPVAAPADHTKLMELSRKEIVYFMHYFL